MSTCAVVRSFIESKTTEVQTSNVGFTSEVSDYLVVHTGPACCYGCSHCLFNVQAICLSISETALLRLVCVLTHVLVGCKYTTGRPSDNWGGGGGGKGGSYQPCGLGDLLSDVKKSFSQLPISIARSSTKDPDIIQHLSEAHLQNPMAREDPK